MPDWWLNLAIPSSLSMLILIISIRQYFQTFHISRHAVSSVFPLPSEEQPQAFNPSLNFQSILIRLNHLNSCHFCAGKLLTPFYTRYFTSLVLKHGISVEEVWRFKNFLQVKIASIWERRKRWGWVWCLEAFKQLEKSGVRINKAIELNIQTFNCGSQMNMWMFSVIMMMVEIRVAV